MRDGPYRERGKQLADQPRVSPVDDHLFGLAQIGGVQLPISTFVVREEDEHGCRVADFLSVGLPLGGLSIMYLVGSYPFGSLDAARIWRPDLDAWFLQLLRGSFSQLARAYSGIRPHRTNRRLQFRRRSHPQRPISSRKVIQEARITVPHCQNRKSTAPVTPVTTI